MTTRSATPLLGFVAYSGTGKTTLLEQLLPLLRKEGLRVGLIKHAHHHFDIDTPGKDSYRLREAGASQVMVASAKRCALICEHQDDRPEPRLPELLERLDHEQLDLILVEGFKHEHYPKVELRREVLEKPLLYPHDSDIIAVASDQPQQHPAAPSVLDLNQPQLIAAWIMQWLGR